MNFIVQIVYSIFSAGRTIAMYLGLSRLRINSGRPSGGMNLLFLMCLFMFIYIIVALFSRTLEASFSTRKCSIGQFLVPLRQWGVQLTGEPKRVIRLLML